jgi:hypothetical protein
MPGVGCTLVVLWFPLDNRPVTLDYKQHTNRNNPEPKGEVMYQ